MQPSSNQTAGFQETVWQYYRQYGRNDMPWRVDPSPYNVLVSELMLQQTQVSRVIPKFNTFIYTCPSFASLAKLTLSDIFELWSGLGYNRRAKYLLLSAQIVTNIYDGHLPTAYDELVRLPGIGQNTAGAIAAYAYQQPVVFIETNIRTVLFHHFFEDTTETVSDKALRELAEQVFDLENPREWYWALMDYGTHLKRTAGGRLETSSHHVKQSKLAGSPREMRGRIMQLLVKSPLHYDELHMRADGDGRFVPAISALVAEGMIERHGSYVGLTGTSWTSIVDTT